jgi:RNA polymerase sigma factor (TIGR02999 family)
VRAAAEKLLPQVYQELRELAAQRMASEKPGQTLTATALVHEVYVRLTGSAEQPPPAFQNRAHFFAAAAEAMRRILIDNARRKHRPKHGGDLQRIDLEVDAVVELPRSEELLMLDEALDRLAKEAPDKAELVKLRFFAGLSLEECALAQGISIATAKRSWAYARAWLYAAMSEKSSQQRF